MNEVVNTKEFEEQILDIRIPSDVVERFPEVLQVPRPEIFIRFCEWYATPTILRKPKTHKQFARMVRVNQDTLTNWKKRPIFNEVVYHFARVWGASKVPDVLLHLYRTLSTAKFNNAPEIKLWFQLIHDWREKSEVENKNINVNYVITRGENKKSSEEGDRPVPGTVDPVAPEGPGIMESISVQDSGGGTEGQEDDF